MGVSVFFFNDFDNVFYCGDFIGVNLEYFNYKINDMMIKSNEREI